MSLGGFRHSTRTEALGYLLATAIPLLVRRRWPIPVFAWIVALTAILGAAMAPALLIAVFAAFVYCRRDVGLGATAIGALVFALSPGHGTAEGAVSRAALVAMAGAVGLWRAERLDRQRREHELLAEQAVADERVRIARELHDVVAHNVSLMVVQAQAVAASASDRDRAALDGLADTGRAAMTEMHRMLGVLRVDGDGAERAPQPGVDDLEALVDRARAAGLDVGLEVEGEARPLPPTVDLTAYRIVQEALTNVVKHAGGAAAGIVVRYGAEALELRVENGAGRGDHGAGGNGAANGGGHGLAGMRERVGLFGGRLEAGPREGGGFAVRAVLPLGGR